MIMIRSREDGIGLAENNIKNQQKVFLISTGEIKRRRHRSLSYLQ
jgi:peptide deformylase